MLGSMASPRGVGEALHRTAAFYREYRESWLRGLGDSRGWPQSPGFRVVRLETVVHNCLEKPDAGAENLEAWA